MQNERFSDLRLMEEEVTKEKFKDLYFKYATVHSGWTEQYWNQFHEREEGRRYFYSAPATSETTRMFIVSDKINVRMIFLTEEADESFFDFRGDE